MKMKAIVLILCSLVLVTGAACSNTVDGFGRDMESTGQKIQRGF